MEIGDRYIEQIQTTMETMRRRCLAYYDRGVGGVSKCAVAIDRLRDVAEPAFYDTSDYISAAANVREGVEKLEKDERNNMVEMYLGIAVLSVGLSCGQLAGVFVLPSLLESLFHPAMEALLVLLLPIHAYLSLKKITAMDDVERRVLLFSLALFEGVLVGHLVGERLVSLVPSTFFIHPLLFALMIDNELICTPFGADRHVLFGASGVASLVLSVLAATVPLGYISFGVLVLAGVHAAMCGLHFQIVTAAAKDKLLRIGDAQMAYIMVLIVAQIMVALPFGSALKQPTGGMNME